MTIQQMKNTEYLEKTWTLTVTYPHENSQEKRKKIVNNCPKKNHFSKDNFNYDHENDDLYLPIGQPL